MKQPKKNLRIGWMFFIVCFAFAAVLARLIHIQIFLSPEYSKKVAKQSSGELELPAQRGLIYDRNGMIVANNVQSNSLYAWPASQKDVKHIAAYLEELFDLPGGTAEDTYNLNTKKFSWIKRMLDDSTASVIMKNYPSGLYLREETERTYPFGKVGKQILGFTNVDGKGQAGLEYAYNSVLAGQDGMAAFRRDGDANCFRIKDQAITQPVPGQSKLLTIDWKLQGIVEEELQRGVAEFNAESGMAVFMNNNNGEILAMAHYDPKEGYIEKPQKLQTLTDLFEPGSVYKVIAAAGLLEDSLIDINDTVFCEEGIWKIGKNRLHDDKKLGWLDFRRIMELSSNIGIGKCALEMGGENLYQLSKKFGIGTKVLSDWPGEARGNISKPKRWSDFAVASLAMGHAVSVNAVQMTNVMAAVANGGSLYEPHLILCDIDDKGQPQSVVQPKILAEIISKETADTLKSFLRGVVEHGTAEKVNSSIVTIAGKTGTAQIYNPETGKYFWSKYMASFLGFFPVEQPLVTGFVVLKNPQPVHYGGHTSGPIFKKIAERYTIINPDLFTSSERLIVEQESKINNTWVVPDFSGTLVTKAKYEAEKKNVLLRANADSGYVVWQYPPPDRLIFENDNILVIVRDPRDDSVAMADLTGLTIREVSAYMQHLGMEFNIKGNGRVYRQSVKPGEQVNSETECRLECRPI